MDTADTLIEPKLEIVDALGHTIATSIGSEITTSTLVDAYGSQLVTGDLVINDKAITKNLEVHGFYRLNDLHDSIKDSDVVLRGRPWRSLAPSNWYNSSQPNKVLTRFFDELSGRCKIITGTPIQAGIDTSTFTTCTNSDRSGNSRIGQELSNSCTNSDHSVNSRSGQELSKPYPIQVIKGGPHQGMYGPIIVVLEYGRWISPALNIDILNTYTRVTNIAQRMAGIFSTVDPELVNSKFTCDSFPMVDGLLNWSQYANHLRVMTGRDIGRNRVLQVLRQLHILHDGSQGPQNTPTEDFVGSGFFKLAKHALPNTTTLVDVVYITELGARKLSNLILERYMLFHSK